MPSPSAKSHASVVDAVRWNDVFPGLLLVKTLRIAFSPAIIALALVGIVAVQGGWRLIDALIARPDAATSLAPFDAAPALIPALPAVVPQDAPLYESLAPRPWIGPLVRAWAWSIQPLTRLAGATGWRQFVGFLVAGIWTIAVWGLFGGAIARIAALALCREERIGPIAAIKAAATRWTATVGAPTFSFTLIVAAGIPLLIAGWMMRLDFFAAVGGLLWIVALGFGIVGAALALLHLIGFPFMWATVAVERTDAFDAVSRSWAYTYSRPLHLAIFIVFASAIGFLAEAMLVLLAQWGVAGTTYGLSWGAGAERVAELTTNPPAQQGLMLGFAIDGVAAWNSLILAIPKSFAMGYLWCVGVAIYLLMRRMVDSTEIDEAAFDDGSPEPSIPKLVADPTTGVPQVESAAPAPAQEPAEA